MAVLSDRHILERLQRPSHDPQALIIAPFSDAVSQPGMVSWGLSSAGYDLRVGQRFLVIKDGMPEAVLSPKGIKPENFTEYMIEPHESIRIPPNCFALAEAMEWLQIPEDVLGVILGKSTYARSGVCVNMTPAEPGWRGRLTIEIANLTPLPCEVYACEGIAQIIFHQLTSLSAVPYSRKFRQKYQDQGGITLPIC